MAQIQMAVANRRDGQCNFTYTCMLGLATLQIQSLGRADRKEAFPWRVGDVVGLGLGFVRVGVGGDGCACRLGGCVGASVLGFMVPGCGLVLGFKASGSLDRSFG